MTTPSSLMVSQELFDETLQENEEVFDLDPPQALAETIAQLTKQQNGDGDLSHLCLLHPDSKEGQQERAERAEFLEYLKLLDDCVDENGNVTIPENNSTTELVNALDKVRKLCSDRDKQHRFLTLIRHHDAMYTLMSLLGVTDDDCVAVLDATIVTLTVVCHHSLDNRDLFVAAWDPWTALYTNKDKSLVSSENLQVHLLQLACAVCKNCQANKIQFMKRKPAVLQLLEGIQVDDSNNNSKERLWTESCRLVSILVRDDDFRPNPNLGPTTSCAHDHVLELANLGAVQVLAELLKFMRDSGNKRVLEVCLTALRGMAIQDHVVQTMVAMGLLNVAQAILKEECLDNNNEKESLVSSSNHVHVVAAVLGLLRNVTANDEIKTTLCQNKDTVKSICGAMKQHIQHPSVQEHGCGLFAAMALRKPKNAQIIVLEHDGHVRIVTGMKQHPNNIAIQRQGSLAIRNLVSRQLDHDAVQQALLDAGAEGVLRDIAGRHQGSVDEAYAALRDLKCAVSLLTISNEGDTVATAATPMFGQVQSSFRPVFELSEGLQGL